MSFRTFFTVYTEHGKYEPVESFERVESTYRIDYYPNQDIVTNDLININSTTTYIPVENIVEIESHEHRM